jgi:hypothetical protein
MVSMIQRASSFPVFSYYFTATNAYACDGSIGFIQRQPRTDGLIELPCSPGG